EDGIRCLIVTGVQTCALPIYGLVVPVRPGPRDGDAGPRGRRGRPARPGRRTAAGPGARGARPAHHAGRAEPLPGGGRAAPLAREIGRASCRERGELRGGAVAT